MTVPSRNPVMGPMVYSEDCFLSLTFIRLWRNEVEKKDHLWLDTIRKWLYKR